MNGGEISGNTARENGGGVYVSGGGEYYNGIFTMSGGEISGNTAGEYGGGVYVKGSVFSKTGGTVLGYSSTDRNSNVVKDSSGAVQSNKGHAIYVHHNNSMHLMKKDTTSGSADNLSFDGSRNPPVSAGEWEWDF
jgi:predicted outer membrane repeat protein